MPCQKVAPYYSIDRNVYHICKNCWFGDSIKPDKRKKGNVGKRNLCGRCKLIIAGKLSR